MMSEAVASYWDDVAMEIKGPGRIEPGIVRRVAKSAPGTSSPFQVSDAGDVRGAIVAGPGPIGALDSILMLQGLDDSTDGRSKGMAHGEQLLDMLDQVRDGLLAGGVPRATLNRLANAVEQQGKALDGVRSLLASQGYTLPPLSKPQ